jgi:hypothetical protein
MNPLLTAGIGGIFETVGNVADDLFTSDEERAKAELDAYKAESERMGGQVEINKIEAANSNVWVSGARPFIMWVCGAAFAYATVVEPVLRFAAKVWFGYAGDFPVIDTDLTMQVLFGILGLGVMRSFDKKAGTSK